MEKILIRDKIYSPYTFKTEEDFERTIIKHAEEIFGTERVYLNFKKLIGMREKRQSIPDGYLFDFSRKNDPRLFVVENEISTHDPFEHIGRQLHKFSVTFKSDKRHVVENLLLGIKRDDTVRRRIEKFLPYSGVDNIDALVNLLVHGKPFQTIVVIDRLIDELREIISEFKFSVDVIEFKAFIGPGGEFIYKFEPFLAEVDASRQIVPKKFVDISSLDTIVVPAWEDGFKRVFIGENRWYAIRLSDSMIPQIKYIAVYRVAPISAITHIAPIKSIKRWKKTDKYVVKFARPAKKIKPIKLVSKGIVKPLYGPRYANYEKLMSAKNLDEVF